MGERHGSTGREGRDKWIYRERGERHGYTGSEGRETWIYRERDIDETEGRETRIYRERPTYTETGGERHGSTGRVRGERQRKGTQ